MEEKFLLRCVDNGNGLGITVGKLYEGTLDERYFGEGYKVTNDRGYQDVYRKCRFEVVEFKKEESELKDFLSDEQFDVIAMSLELYVNQAKKEAKDKLDFNSFDNAKLLIKYIEVAEKLKQEFQ